MVLPALSRLLNMHRTRVLMLQAQRFYFEGKFKPESEERILQVLNASKELEDILRYSISKKNGSKILADKTEKGGYQTLDDPVAIVPPPVSSFMLSVKESVCTACVSEVDIFFLL